MSEVRTGALLAYASTVVNSLVALVYTPFLVRMMDQGEYGVYRMSDSVITSLSVLSLGFGTAYVRFHARLKVARDENGISNLNGMYFLIFAGMGVFALIGGLGLAQGAEGLFSEGLDSTQIALASRLMLVMTANVALTFPTLVFSNYVLAAQRFRWMYGRTILLSIAGPALGAVLLLMGWGPLGAALATTAMTVVRLLWNGAYAVGRLGMRFRFLPFRLSQLREVSLFSVWVFVTDLAGLLTNNVHSFLLASRASASEVAVFAVAFQLRQVFYAMSGSLARVFTPRINTLVALGGTDQELLTLMTRVGRYQLVMHLVCLGGFVVVGRDFLALWAGAEYDPAYWLVILMMGSVTAHLIQNTGVHIQQAKNMHHFRSIIFIAAGVVGATLSWLLAPGNGALAGAIGYSVTMVAGSWIAMNWYYHAKVGLNMRRFWTAMLPIMLAVTLVTALFSLITNTILPINGVVSLVFVGCLFTVVAGASLWWLVFTKEERSDVTSLLRVPFRKGPRA